MQMSKKTSLSVWEAVKIQSWEGAASVLTRSCEEQQLSNRCERATAVDIGFVTALDLGFVREAFT